MKTFSLRHLLVFCIAVILISSGCKLTKKQQSSTIVEKIITDEMVINGRQNDITSMPYQPSSARLNDIRHMILDVRFDYAKQFVIGKATLFIKPYAKPQSKLTLDAKSFELKKVSIIYSKDTLALSYTYDSMHIDIQLNKQYAPNEEYIVYIEYIAKPNENKNKGSAAINDAKGLYFINPTHTDKDKPRQIWTQGETESNSGWFPTIDKPNEKLTHEIYVTVDEKDISLSNGELIYSKINADKTHTDYWKQSLPHSAYLVMLAIGEFSIIKDRWRDSIEVNYYVEPEYKPYAKMVFGNTPEMLEFFSKRLGVDYPWDKFSQIVVRDFVSGAMENTSAVIHFSPLQHNSREHLDNTFESIISHELFHHWFGDLVTCESWSNIPLNESFATYGSYLWDEYKYGKLFADHSFNDNLQAYLQQRSGHYLTPIRYHYHSREEMFDVVSYQKGSRILHMLRNYLGDELFFKSLQYYLNLHRFKNVEIHDLRLAFEYVTGEDLNWFFNQWFLSPGHPVLSVEEHYSENRKNITIDIHQEQDTSLMTYRLPLAIDFYTEQGIIRKQIDINERHEQYEFAFNHPVMAINFDADKVLLGTITNEKNLSEHIYLLQHAPMYNDKANAVEGIVALFPDSINDGIKQSMMYCFGHPFFGIRQLGFALYQKLNDKDKKYFIPTITQLAMKDSIASIRREAVTALRDADAKDRQALFEQMLNDSSYQVVAEALNALTDIQPQKALEVIRKNWLSEKNGSIQVAVVDIIGKNSSADEISFFENKLNSGGFYKYNIMAGYWYYLRRMDSTYLLRAIPGLNAYYKKHKGKEAYMESLMDGMEKDLEDIYLKKQEALAIQLKKTKTNSPQREQLLKQGGAYDALIDKIRLITHD